MLEWFEPSQHSKIVSLAAVVAVLVAFGTFKTGGLSWVSDPWFWLIMMITLALLWIVLTKQRQCAGADWLMDGKVWVLTYALTRVTAHRLPGAIQLKLIDADGRRLDVKATELQDNPRLWDLVYNGILHSVHVNGAETNSLARKYLKLDSAPADDR